MGSLIIAALAAQAITGAEPATRAEKTDSRHVGLTTYLDIEGAAGYSTNPDMRVISDKGRGYGRLDLHGVHSRVSELSTTVLSAYASNTTYTGSYGSQQALSVDLRHDTSVSERLRIYGLLNASYDEGGQLDTRILSQPVVPPLPGAPGTPPQLLPGGSDFLSVRGRHYRVFGEAGGSYALSERDNLNFDGGLEHSIFKGGAADSHFTTARVSTGYERQLSPRTTLGGRVRYENTDYSGPTSFHTITPQVTASVQLSEQLSLNGAVGVSFATVDDGIRTRHSTGLSGQVGLCSLGEAGSLCASAAADQETATTAGPAKSQSANIDYSRRLDADSTIAFSLSASHYSSPIAAVSGFSFSSSNYFRVAANYSRRIGDRWFGGVNLAGRKITQRGPDPKTDFDASLFIRYRFGDI